MERLIDLSENVIRIQTIESEGFGTAFLLNYEGDKYWITAKHVFFGKSTEKAKLLTKESAIEFEIDECKFHPVYDIMYFTVKDDFPLKKLKGLNYCIPNYDCYGNDVYCLGFPYNVEFDISINKTKVIPCIKQGVVNAVCGKSNFLVDIMLVSGCSGGPIIMKHNNTYKVIGIISYASIQSLYDKDEKKPIETCNYGVPDGNTLCVNIQNIVELINDLKNGK
jgi:hypothetical protein